MTDPPAALPVPPTPAGMDEKTWAKFVADLALDGGQLVSDYLLNPGTGIPGPGSGFGNASQYNSLVALIQEMYGVDRATAQGTAYLWAKHVNPTLSDALAVNEFQSQGLAEASADSLANYGAANGLPIQVQTDAWHAAMNNGITNMTADWKDLDQSMLADVVSAVQQGLALGLSPTEAGRKVGQALTEAGQGGYARGLLIARTQMADMQTNARLADLQQNSDTFGGWWWRARPDGCPICQIQHGRRYNNADQMYAHHMCRCVTVPWVTGAQAWVKRGDYIPGEQRPTKDILDPPPPSMKHAKRGQVQQKGIPQSWRDDMPDDPRELLALRENGTWRDSWTLAKPGEPLKPGLKPPPGPAKTPKKPKVQKKAPVEPTPAPKVEAPAAVAVPKGVVSSKDIAGKVSIEFEDGYSGIYDAAGKDSLYILNEKNKWEELPISKGHPLHTYVEGKQNGAADLVEAPKAPPTVVPKAPPKAAKPKPPEPQPTPAPKAAPKATPKRKPGTEGEFGVPPKGVREMEFQDDPTRFSQGRAFAWDGGDIEDMHVMSSRTKDGQVLQWKATSDMEKRIMAEAPKIVKEKPSEVLSTRGDWAKKIAEEKYPGHPMTGEVTYAVNKFGADKYNPAFHKANLKGSWATPENEAYLDQLANDMSKAQIEAAKKAPAVKAPAKDSPWQKVGGNKMAARIPSKNSRWDDADSLTSGDGFTLKRDLGDGIEVRFSSSTKMHGTDVQYSYRNTVQVFVPDGVDPREALRRLDRDMGVKARYPTEADMRKYAENKLIGLDWDEGTAIRAGKSTEATRKAALDRLKTRYGVTPDDITWEQDWYGHLQAVLPDRVARKIADDAQIGHFTHNLSSYDWIGEALSDPSGPPLTLTSTHRRFTTDVRGGGMSSSTDTMTGGGEYVFLRQSRGRPDSNFIGIALDPARVLRRTDRFSYSNDSYGVLNQGTSYWRNKGIPGDDGLKVKSGSRETMVKGRVEVGEGQVRLGQNQIINFVRAAKQRNQWTPEVRKRFEYYLRDQGGGLHDWDKIEDYAV